MPTQIENHRCRSHASRLRAFQPVFTLHPTMFLCHGACMAKAGAASGRNGHDLEAELICLPTRVLLRCCMKHTLFFQSLESSEMKRQGCCVRQIIGT